MKDNVLSIDIGGSKIVAAIVDIDGNIVELSKILLPDVYNAEMLTKIIFELIEPFMKHHPKSVGVSIPGLADHLNGVWKYSPFSGITNFPIANVISQKTGLNCYIENDVNACALGEKEFGKCKDTDDFLWITISNGVGGALFLNGHLYRGRYCNAGEIGHFFINNHTYKCGCGRNGCLETFASGQAISKEYEKRTGKKLSAEKIAIDVKNGDKIAKFVFDRAGAALGKAISYCVNLLNINKIILGGGVSASYDLLLPSMQKTLDKYVFMQANGKITPEKTGLGYYASVIGASVLALQNK